MLQASTNSSIDAKNASLGIAIMAKNRLYNMKNKVFLVWGPFVDFLWRMDQQCKTFQVILATTIEPCLQPNPHLRKIGHKCSLLYPILLLALNKPSISGAIFVFFEMSRSKMYFLVIQRNLRTLTRCKIYICEIFASLTCKTKDLQVCRELHSTRSAPKFCTFHNMPKWSFHL